MTLTEAQVEQSHIIDDLATENARLRRAVAAAVPMLTDALHALRNGSPHVTDEYLDRTILDLTRSTTR
jgi:hypothetical protein